MHINGLSVQQIEEAFCSGNLQGVLYPLDSVLGHMPSAIVDIDTQRNIKNGILIELRVEGGPDSQWCRAYSDDGRIIALLKYDQSEGKWHPRKVFI